MLCQLPDADREILIMKYLEGLNSIECAAVLEVSVAAVKKRHVRAILRFRSLLDSESS